MPYGIELYDSSGNVTLSMSSRTIKLAADVTVTVPSTGTVTVNVPSVVTSTNSIVALANGAPADVTSPGVVTLQPAYFEDSSRYTTKLEVFLL